MTILCSDFMPLPTRQSMFSTTYETFHQMMARVNTWVESEGVRVINVETVLLPDLDAHSKTTARKFSPIPSLTVKNTWYQVIRVWYEIDESRVVAADGNDG